MTERSGLTQAIAITAVPIGLQRPSGDLHTLSMTRASDRLRTQLIRSGLGDCVIIGGLDFSFNEHGRGRWRSHWQPHWYLVIIGQHPNQVRNCLLRYFPADQTIPRPIKTRLITDPFAALSYVWKSVFFRRVTYIGKNRRQETRKLPLKPEQTRELALCLDEHAPTNRLFFRNVRRRGCRLKISRPVDGAVSVNRANELFEACRDAI